MSKKKIVEALNQDRADELAAIIQYMGHHYEAEGMESPEIIDIFWVGSTEYDSQFHLICKWTIFDTKGKALYVNTINAMGKVNNSPSLPSTRVRKAMTQSAEDLYNKLILQMYSSKWWEYFR